MMKHPAKFSKPILDVLREVVWADAHEKFPEPYFVLDPFAGVGGVHDLDSGTCHTTGIELEPEWANMHVRTRQGSALDLGYDAEVFDAIVTSPCYGNRMADKDMRDSVAGTYAKSLGRHASEDSSCHLQWGDKYKEFHGAAWREAVRVLKPGGLFCLNASDHIRGGVRQHVVGWHTAFLIHPMGLYVQDIIPVRTRRQRNGANASARVDAELIVVLRKL